MEVSQFLIEGPRQKVVNSLQVSKSDPIVRRIFFTRPETRFFKIQNKHLLGGRSNFSTNFSSQTIVSDKRFRLKVTSILANYLSGFDQR